MIYLVDRVACAHTLLLPGKPGKKDTRRKTWPWERRALRPLLATGLRAPIVHQAIVTLTNAQIEEWPTTPLDLVAAPAAERVLIPVTLAINRGA